MEIQSTLYMGSFLNPAVYCIDVEIYCQVCVGYVGSVYVIIKFVYYFGLQVSEDERKTEVIDLWSEDTKQDAWFTESALDIGFQWLESVYPGFSVYLFSGRLIKN